MPKKKTAKKKSGPPASLPVNIAGTRYFELIAGKSKKFWEIDVAGKKVTTRYGRIGTDGQATEKSFDIDSEAQEHASKLIAEKTRKGYTETSRGISAARQGFEEQLLENPDDVETLAVYADWLVEQQDPRGELIHVQLALEDEGLSAKQREPLKAQEEKLLGEHRDEWLGEFAAVFQNNPETETVEEGNARRLNYAYRFARGHLHSLDICWLAAPMSRALRDSPQTRFLRELSIGSVAEDDWPEEVVGDLTDEEDLDHLQPLLETREFPSLRRFQYGEEVDMDSFITSRYGVQNHVYGRHVPELVEKMPRLEELHLLCKSYDVVRLFRLKTLTHLRVLRIYHLGVHEPGGDRKRYEYPLDVLAKNPAVKNLTHLLFHPHMDEYHRDHRGDRKPSYLPLDQVEALVRSPLLKNLTHLQLRLSNMGDEGCRLLVESGFLGQLKWLDLRHGCISDDGASLLAASPDLAGLDHLDLSRNGLTQEGIAALQATGVQLRADAQQTEQELADEAYLYEGDSE